MGNEPIGPDPVEIVNKRIEICHLPEPRPGDYHAHQQQRERGDSLCAGCACQAINQAIAQDREQGKAGISNHLGQVMSLKVGSACGLDCRFENYRIFGPQGAVAFTWNEWHELKQLIEGHHEDNHQRERRSALQ